MSWDDDHPLAPAADALAELLLSVMEEEQTDEPQDTGGPAESAGATQQSGLEEQE